MVLQGATTLWETWTGSRYAPDASWNHIMFGSQSAWYYESLAGLQLAPGSRGFERLLLKPSVWAGAASPPVSICSNLSFVTASVKTIRGIAAAAWQCGEPKEDPAAAGPIEQFTYTITVPLGSTASVVLPTFGAGTTDPSLTITEGGQQVWAGGKYVPGTAGAGVVNATAGRDAGGAFVAVEVGSGSYSFKVVSQSP